MVNKILPITVFLINFCIDGMALSSDGLQKYPNILIGDDYGILDVNDLKSFYDERMHSSLFNGSDSQFSHVYWQCFSRDHITVLYEDTGYSPEDMLNIDTLAELSITALVRPGLVHEYTVRSLMPADFYENTLHEWRSLMKNVKYVCLAGEYGSHKLQVRDDGTTREVYTWNFDQLKTKNGCDSYFYEHCDRIVRFIKQ